MVESKQRNVNGDDDKDKVNDGIIDESQQITEDVKDKDKDVENL